MGAVRGRERVAAAGSATPCGDGAKPWARGGITGFVRRILPVLVLASSLGSLAVRGDEVASATASAASATAASASATAASASATAAHATFAGGCFWCMQPPFENLPGVVDTTVGYTGGSLAHPTYEQVSAGGTGHAEAIDVVYDPKQIRYEQLLDVFWHDIDPLTRDAQFCDHGRQYRTAIFYHDETQRRLAEASKRALEQSGRLPGPIVTEIVPAGPFWPAEEYHQRYHEKNPVRYRYYRWSCGRDRRLQEIWGADAPAGSDPPAEPSRAP